MDTAAANLLGSLVGQSEANIRQALRIIDAMAPAVLFLDECEKAFSGVSGQGDSGVSAWLFGSFLSWLNDHESDVFVVATANQTEILLFSESSLRSRKRARSLAGHSISANSAWASTARFVDSISRSTRRHGRAHSTAFRNTQCKLPCSAILLISVGQATMSAFAKRA